MDNPKNFLDTQILIAAIQNAESVDIERARVASIVASEFLGAVSPDPVSANYYVPLVSQRHAIMNIPNRPLRRDHAFSKMSTDWVKMEFGGVHPPIIHFGNYAMSEIINNKSSELFNSVISHLPKEKRKTLKRKFSFLLEREIECVPLSSEAIEKAQGLLASLKEQNSLKNNFRNSWNDLLIAAIAIENSGTLHTHDNLLARQIAEYMEASIVEKESFLSVDYSVKEEVFKKNNQESKGYVNRGWQVEFSKQSRRE
ncbi:hypothetical protein ALQ04_02331 [Pseudomonas cichorii]|uniref:PIN domain-containing protein n=1 Tax=Pseudomonas cichorii TaxID=36746 RepID=A0A3M4M960_PSECI|nr:hypothetical protein [Pseudomonas cichorii]RMQ50083.1 hypothetical protein ALQ04_02331 [Pseudomonas cichorii]